MPEQRFLIKFLRILSQNIQLQNRKDGIYGTYNKELNLATAY